MPDTNSHIKRAESNFSFLDSIKETDFNDWKVTVSFYTALHILNAFIFDKTGIHYKTHNQVEQATNPYNKMSPCKLDEDTYSYYQSLLGLSKRSRYMVHEINKDDSNTERLIYDKHVEKSYRHLNKIIENFPKYCKNFNCIEIKNLGVKPGEMKYFKKVS